ncbi:hypothetical protein B0H12DRAFT_1067249 [Mycena haematopus]|nr:hypothetical protein B0H12DRAFT_1067249 [Mycena haematopus]
MPPPLSAQVDTDWLAGWVVIPSSTTYEPPSLLSSHSFLRTRVHHQKPWQTHKLNDGYEIPSLAFGTWKLGRGDAPTTHYRRFVLIVYHECTNIENYFHAHTARHSYWYCGLPHRYLRLTVIESRRALPACTRKVDANSRRGSVVHDASRSRTGARGRKGKKDDAEVEVEVQADNAGGGIKGRHVGVETRRLTSWCTRAEAAESGGRRGEARRAGEYRYVVCRLGAREVRARGGCGERRAGTCREWGSRNATAAEAIESDTRTEDDVDSGCPDSTLTRPTHRLASRVVLGITETGARATGASPPLRPEETSSHPAACVPVLAHAAATIPTPSRLLAADSQREDGGRCGTRNSKEVRTCAARESVGKLDMVGREQKRRDGVAAGGEELFRKRSAFVMPPAETRARSSFSPPFLPLTRFIIHALASVLGSYPNKAEAAHVVLYLRIDVLVVEGIEVLALVFGGRRGCESTGEREAPRGRACRCCGSAVRVFVSVARGTDTRYAGGTATSNVDLRAADVRRERASQRSNEPGIPAKTEKRSEHWRRNLREKIYREEGGQNEEGTDLARSLIQTMYSLQRRRRTLDVRFRASWTVHRTPDSPTKGLFRVRFCRDLTQPSVRFWANLSGFDTGQTQIFSKICRDWDQAFRLIIRGPQSILLRIRLAIAIDSTTEADEISDQTQPRRSLSSDHSKDASKPNEANAVLTDLIPLLSANREISAQRSPPSTTPPLINAPFVTAKQHSMTILRMGTAASQDSFFSLGARSRASRRRGTVRKGGDELADDATSTSVLSPSPSRLHSIDSFLLIIFFASHILSVPLPWRIFLSTSLPSSLVYEQELTTPYEVYCNNPNRKKRNGRVKPGKDGREEFANDGASPSVHFLTTIRLSSSRYTVFFLHVPVHPAEEEGAEETKPGRKKRSRALSKREGWGRDGGAQEPEEDGGYPFTKFQLFVVSLRLYPEADENAENSEN